MGTSVKYDLSIVRINVGAYQEDFFPVAMRCDDMVPILFRLFDSPKGVSSMM